MKIKNNLKVFAVKRLENYSYLRYKFSKKPKLNYEKEFKKIAIICTTPLGIGDLIMTTPFIKSLRKGFPKAKIHLITDKDIFDSVSELDKVIVVKGSLFNLGAEFKKLRKSKYDLGIVANRGINQSFYLNKLNSRFKLGYLGGYNILANFKLENKNLFFNKNEHFRNMSLKIVQALGLNTQNELMKPIYSKNVKNSVENIFKNLNLNKNKKVIGINPYVLWETRRWDEQNYIKLIKELSSKFNFVLTGGPDSFELNKKIEFELKKIGIKILNLTGKLNLKESIYAMKKFDLFLTADCGPMHFALMMRTPTLALFGPVNPMHRMPYKFESSKKYDSLWYLDYNKGKMYDYESEHFEDEMVGLKAIPVKDVKNKILKFFKKGGFN